MSAKKKSAEKSSSAATPKTSANKANGVTSSGDAKPKTAGGSKATAATKAVAAKVAAKRPSANKDALRSRLSKGRALRPVAFSLDEVKEVAKDNQEREQASEKQASSVAAERAAAEKAKLEAQLAAPAKPNHVKAASLADILGFSIGGANKPKDEIESIPEKHKRYYRLLIELRDHVTGQLTTHTEDTLKRSTKDDSGDLSSYGQHMADAGTDTFDRDFALSLVSNEQEALSEIEAAISRIKKGIYGVCEATGKPIAKERLLAVPFTRYSAEAQKEIERNRLRVRTQAGLFGEMGDDAGKMMNDSGDDD